MSEDASDSGGTLTEATRRRLTEVRRALLRLHKALLDEERADYERVYGQVTSGELLQLVINHEQFTWLHALSELIVRMDELLDAVEPATADDAESLVEQARALLKPSDAGGEFGPVGKDEGSSVTGVVTVRSGLLHDVAEPTLTKSFGSSPGPHAEEVNAGPLSFPG